MLLTNAYVDYRAYNKMRKEEHSSTVLTHYEFLNAVAVSCLDPLEEEVVKL